VENPPRETLPHCSPSVTVPYEPAFTVVELSKFNPRLTNIETHKRAVLKEWFVSGLYWENE